MAVFDSSEKGDAGLASRATRAHTAPALTRMPVRCPLPPRRRTTTSELGWMVTVLPSRNVTSALPLPLVTMRSPAATVMPSVARALSPAAVTRSTRFCNTLSVAAPASGRGPFVWAAPATGSSAASASPRSARPVIPRGTSPGASP